jgi:hypothetical protein
MPGFVARVADEREDLLAYPAQQRLERTVPPRSPLMAAAEGWPPRPWIGAWTPPDRT